MLQVSAAVMRDSTARREKIRAIWFDTEAHVRKHALAAQA
jgi:hypothetical protein